jgi:hypothetical protein
MVKTFLQQFCCLLHVTLHNGQIALKGHKNIIEKLELEGWSYCPYLFKLRTNINLI